MIRHSCGRTNVSRNVTGRLNQTQNADGSWISDTDSFESEGWSEFYCEDCKSNEGDFEWSVTVALTEDELTALETMIDREAEEEEGHGTVIRLQLLKNLKQKLHQRMTDL